ncbi:lasso RiPP family leader peptide-containing protein [Aurantiacibacter suaedae]|nr:lasso RiPP family leader peptide-containing protein [Aurantiacibacter suaedae]
MAKKTYEAPKFEKLGSFEAMTKGSSTGNTLDQAFPVGTPEENLTFS